MEGGFASSTAIGRGSRQLSVCEKARVARHSFLAVVD
jgi:hypothetical protein